MAFFEKLFGNNNPREAQRNSAEIRSAQQYEEYVRQYGQMDDAALEDLIDSYRNPARRTAPGPQVDQPFIDPTTQLENLPDGHRIFEETHTRDVTENGVVETHTVRTYVEPPPVQVVPENAVPTPPPVQEVAPDVAPTTLPVQEVVPEALTPTPPPVQETVEVPPVAPPVPQPLSPEEKSQLKAAEQVYANRLKLDIQAGKELSPRQRSLLVRNLTEEGAKSALGELFIQNQGFKNWDDALRQFDVKSYLHRDGDNQLMKVEREDKTWMDKLPRFLRDRMKDTVKGGAISLATMGVVALFGGAVSLPIVLGAVAGSVVGKGVADLLYRNRKLYKNHGERRSLAYETLGQLMGHMSMAQSEAARMGALNTAELTDEQRQHEEARILNTLVAGLYRRDFDKAQEFRKTERNSRIFEAIGGVVGGVAGGAAGGFYGHGAETSAQLDQARTDGIRVDHNQFTDDPTKGHIVRYTDGNWRYAIEPKDLAQINEIYHAPFVDNFHYVVPGTGSEGAIVTPSALEIASNHDASLHWLGAMSAPQQAASQLAMSNAVQFGSILAGGLIAGEVASFAGKEMGIARNRNRAEGILTSQVDTTIPAPHTRFVTPPPVVSTPESAAAAATTPEAVAAADAAAAEAAAEQVPTVEAPKVRLIEGSETETILEGLTLQDEKRSFGLSKEMIIAAGMVPKYEIESGEQKIIIAGTRFKMGSRLVGYAFFKDKSKNGAETWHVLPYTMSSSQGLYRFYPAIQTEQVSGSAEEKLLHFNKSDDELAITMPAEMQRALADVHTKESIHEPADTLEQQSLFMGVFDRYTDTANPGQLRYEVGKPFRRPVTSGTPDNRGFKGMKKTSTSLELPLPAGPGTLVDPEKLTFVNAEDGPDFGKKLTEWSERSELYGGDVRYSTFKSKNETFTYTFATAPTGQAWIAHIELTDEKPNVLGLKNNWVNVGALTMPAKEYGKQIFGYGDAARPEEYQDAYDLYLKKVPVIREFQDFSGVNPDTLAKKV